MKKLLVIFLLFMFLFGCFKNKHKESVASYHETKTVTVKTKPPSSFHQFLIITEACALFYQPDSVQREKIKAVTEARIFEASMHNFLYQQKYAHKFLKEHWPRLKIAQAKNVRFIAFFRKDGSCDMIDLDRLADAYGLLVFDRMKPPLQIDMTNTETMVAGYFKNIKE